MTGDDNQALRAALRSGDSQRLRVFFDRHYDAMAVLVRATVDTEDDVDDVIQSVWREAIAAGAGIRNHGSSRAFLFSFLLPHLGEDSASGTQEGDELRADSDAADGTAISSADEFVPDGMPWAGHWEELPQPWSPAAEAWLRSADGRRVITGFLDSLSMVDRVVLVLRDMDGWSASEVTGLSGLGSDDQQVVLGRARIALHAAIDRATRELT